MVTFLNPIAATLTGWSPQEADGHPLESVLPLINESTGEVIENPARQAIRERRTIAMANHTNLKRRDGSWIPVDDSVAPIFDAKEELKGSSWSSGTWRPAVPSSGNCGSGITFSSMPGLVWRC
ncbi:MAG: PAS domain S-box protein [Bryobacterales bacterium]|nr:PAS domain S-box protein [Bryobacterales bacterium]